MHIILLFLNHRIIHHNLQLSMKNLSDISKTMSDSAGLQDVSVVAPGDLKLHSGVNFLGMDIDDAVTLVWYCCIFTLKILQQIGFELH